jgi:hypothetical protein
VADRIYLFAMEPTRERLVMYGQVNDAPMLEWSTVVSRLESARFYWIDASSGEKHPHIRPVWGVWLGDALGLTVGSPRLRRLMQPDQLVTVHVDSATEVVIVEGRVAEPTAEPRVINAYNAKYDWTYDVTAYGPLLVVVPSSVIAWEAVGPDGREGFRATAKWSIA